MPKIHPAAIVDASAKLADDVEVGAYAIIDPDVVIGEGTVIRPHAMIRRYTSMGKGNYVDSFAVLGGEPQDYKFDPHQVSYLRIGDENKFREGVTISRATGQGQATTVGNHTYWMACSHAGHNCEIQDNVILPNGSLVAGHSTIGRGAIMPAAGAVHQFVWIGEKCMFQGGTVVGMHVPPYCIVAGVTNVVSLNTVGLRRSPEISEEDRRQIKEAFTITYKRHLTPAQALEKMDACTDWGEAAGKFRDFIRKVIQAEKPYNRGLCPNLSRITSRHG